MHLNHTLPFRFFRFAFRGWLVVVIFLGLKNVAHTQDRVALQQRFELRAATLSTPIVVDGRLDEPAWQTPSVAQDFWHKWPLAGHQATTKTEVRVARDAQFLYVAAMCYDSTPEYIIQSLKRDADYWSSDGLAVVIDPANAAQNGYFFGLTSEGVQAEALLSATSEEPDFNWDNVWYAETQHLANGWSLEMAIPLYILRYDASKDSWGINFIRSDASMGQWHTWTEIPLQFDGIDLGWTGRVTFEKAPQRASGNYAVIPYRSVGVTRDYEQGGNTDVVSGAGIDARVGIGSALNLDVTVNPDFSQIEIDEQVVNLTRFSIFLPEKRTFFLENADVFTRFGIPPIRPFFSRRIGLDPNGAQVPIIGGLRLTGNLDPDTRVGAFSMQTRSTEGAAAQNFSAVALNRRVFGRSTLGGYFNNRQAFDDQGADRRNFGRNAGGDFTWVTPDGRWTSWAAYHHAFNPNSTPREAGGGSNWFNMGTYYNAPRMDLVVDLLRMNPNYRTDMGFETRLGNYDALYDTVRIVPYQWVFVEGSIRFIPKNQAASRLNQSSLGFSSFSVFNFDGTINEQNAALRYSWNFKNTAGLDVEVVQNWYDVPTHFKFDDRPNAECPPLPPGEYQAATGSLAWESDGRKRLNWSVELRGGQFYNGTQLGTAVELRYRAQPWSNFQLRAEYNRLDFPAPYCGTTLLNLTPRIEIFFNRNLNWTTFVQYNTQADNFNINSRMQWRFRPMSDLFLVYTDNYAVQFWGPKSRAFVAKMNYWW
jgi:hypothetical protein